MQKLGLKIGILGGGQLGKMLFQAGSRLGLDISIMDKDKSFPSAYICPDFFCGDINNYDDVMKFGQDKDIITIEIEGVNIEALETLEANGKKVYPQPHILKIIKDKGKQKMFYEGKGFPSSEFALFKDAEEIRQAIRDEKISIPFVQKLRKDGYDGRGVQIVKNETHLSKLLEGPTLVEELIEVRKEIAVIVARNENGDITAFPPVEMVFHPTANLVEFLSCPADINNIISKTAEQLAIDLTEAFGIVGLLAVEMFIDTNDCILINEVAPRPHNSGHHTIEACITSQYEMHLRAILNLPLGDTTQVRPAVMINLLGEEGYSGTPVYENIESCLSLSGVYPHIYGKKETRPFRKMGHVTVTDINLNNAIEKAKFVRNHLKIKT